MATKPATAPRRWGTNPLYTTGPFIGQPGKVDPGIGVAAEGHRPGAAFPTPAEFENYQQDRITNWVTDWLRLGAFDPDPDAHLVETDATGRAGVHGLDVINTVDEIAVNISGVNTFVPTVLATCATGATVFQADIGTSSGTGFSCSVQGAGVGSAFNATLTTSSTGAAGLRVTGLNTGAVGVDIDFTGGAGLPFRITNGANNTRAAFIDSLGSVTAMGLDVRVGGFSAAIQATGGPGGGNAVRAFQQGGTGYAVYATTSATATSAARAVRAVASGAATGLEAVAASSIGADNAAVRASVTGGFASSELHFVGRAGDSTTTSAGRVNQNTTTGTLTISDPYVGEQKDFHASRGGLALGCGANNSATNTNNNSAAYTTAAILNLVGLNAPRRAGVKVVLRFSCSAGRTSTVNPTGIIDFQLIDVTANPGVHIFRRQGAGNLVGAGYILTENSLGWQKCITFDFEYTIPAAGDRIFHCEFKPSTTDGVIIRDPVLTPLGAYV
jgi:hypothetical protein